MASLKNRAVGIAMPPGPGTHRLPSVAVFASWHGGHNDCRLRSSSVPPADLGMMWSRMVAGVRRPFFLHVRHSGSLRRPVMRLLRHAAP